MKHIVDLPTLLLHDKYGRRTLSKIISASNIPNYFPKGERPKMIEAMNLDEVYLLPIELSEFKQPRKQFYGIKYIFSLGEHNTVEIRDAPEEYVRITSVQLIMDVLRFRFRVRNDYNIIVDKECDPLFPTRWINIDAPADKIGMLILNVTRDAIDDLNKFYIDRNI